MGLVGTCWARLGIAVAAGVGSGFAFPYPAVGCKKSLLPRTVVYLLVLSIPIPAPLPSDNCYSNGAVCVWFSLAPLFLLDLSSLWQQVFLLIIVGTAYKGGKEESKQSCWAFQSSVHTVCGCERRISCYFRSRGCLNSVLYHGVGGRRYSFLSDFTSLSPLPLVFLGGCDFRLEIGLSSSYFYVNETNNK